MSDKGKRQHKEDGFSQTRQHDAWESRSAYGSASPSVVPQEPEPEHPLARGGPRGRGDAQQAASVFPHFAEDVAESTNPSRVRGGHGDSSNTQQARPSAPGFEAGASSPMRSSMFSPIRGYAPHSPTIDDHFSPTTGYPPHSPTIDDPPPSSNPHYMEDYESDLEEGENEGGEKAKVDAEEDDTPSSPPSSPGSDIAADSQIDPEMGVYKEEHYPKRDPSSAIGLGEVVEYKESTASGGRGVVGDNLTGDHIPSDASNRRRLFGTDTRSKIRDKGLTWVVSAAQHRTYSRTYGGKNTSSQIKADADNPTKAVYCDVRAYLHEMSAAATLTPAVVASGIELYSRHVQNGTIAPNRAMNNLFRSYMHRGRRLARVRAIATQNTGTPAPTPHASGPSENS